MPLTFGNVSILWPLKLHTETDLFLNNNTTLLVSSTFGSNKSFSFYLVCGVIIQGQESCRFMAVSSLKIVGDMSFRHEL